jgi:4a-hydroxytetrahydrobiopterin dehydratase
VDHQPLDDPALASALATLPMWSGDATALRRTYTFPSFLQAIAFMHDSAPSIDSQNHHPRWTNTYSTIKVELSTHDAGNTVTQMDVALAHLLERIALKHSAN